MNIETVAKALKELGHPTRLAIFKRMIKAGHEGIAVGAIQNELDLAGSTLSHHISSLVSADLIEQRREGRVLYCVAKYEQLEATIQFLQEECCTG
ncbi:MAG: ArsR/SmtB family transcription factor [Arenicella sp.]